MKIMVVDGKNIEKVGKCHKVKLQIQYYNLELEFYIVPLGGVDAILGIQWLQTLGTYSANHQEHFINLNGKEKDTNYMGSNLLARKLCHPTKWRS